MMYLSGSCDNTRKISTPLVSRPTSARKRPHVAPGSLLHRRCAAKLYLCRCLRSGEEYRPNSVRHPQTRRDGRAPHRAYNAQVGFTGCRGEGTMTFEMINHEIFFSIGCRRCENERVPNVRDVELGGNWTGLQILTTSPAAASYRKRKRLRWRTRTRSASISICCLGSESLEPDAPSCVDWDWETRMPVRAS